MVSYNRTSSHRLVAVSGYNLLSHLQFTAPFDGDTQRCDNGLGQPQGLPSGSVVSLNEDGNLIAGCTGSNMPLFLLWNADSPDAYNSHTTIDGQHLTAVSGNNSSGKDIRQLLSEAALQSGNASSMHCTWSGDTFTVSDVSTIGNYTTWPATCAMELTSTEYDVSVAATEFAPGTQLTSPAPEDEPEATAQSAEWYQKRRGGYLRPAEANDNVCGVVSRPPERNENGVMILHFWPCYCPTSEKVTDLDTRVTALESADAEAEGGGA